MAHQDGLSEWTAQVSSNLPQLSKPQATLLAWWSYAIVMVRGCGRTTVATFLALLLGRKAESLNRRLREFSYEPQAKSGAKRGICRRALEVDSCFAPLLAWVLRLWQGRTLALAIDASTLSNRFALLAVSVVYRGCAIPVAWAIVPVQLKGAWRRHWLRLLRLLRPAVPADYKVLVLADRGLYARWLFRRIARLGWHPFLRVRRGCTFQPRGQQRWLPMAELVPKVGCQWSGRGEAFKSKKSRLSCTLLACWAEGSSEPWYVLSTLDVERAEVAWYGLRSWCEQGFKVLKRGAWQWQHTRVLKPERAERLLLALAVATLWMLSVGGELEDEVAVLELPEAVAALLTPGRGRKRRVRLLRLALLWLLVCLLRGKPLPMPKRLVPEPWPKREVCSSPPPAGALS